MRTIVFDVFSPLNGTVRGLWLDFNRLQTIGQEFESMFRGLESLKINGNQFSCTCSLLWLKNLLDDDPFKLVDSEYPNCINPARLDKRDFRDVTPCDFGCESPVIVGVETEISTTEGSLYCVARGLPKPKVYWITPNNNTIHYPVAINSTDVSQGFLNVTDDIISGRGVSGQYVCIAESYSGKTNFTFNLLLLVPDASWFRLSSLTPGMIVPTVTLPDDGSTSVTNGLSKPKWFSFLDFVLGMLFCVLCVRF